MKRRNLTSWNVAGSRRGLATGRAFTLVEVLAALVLIAIVLPVVMQGVTMATDIASQTRRKTQAAGLAQAKLNELIVTGEWENGAQSGDFSPDFPEIKWQTQSEAWQEDGTGVEVYQVDIVVSWTARNREQSIRLSTLARSNL